MDGGWRYESVLLSGRAAGEDATASRAASTGASSGWAADGNVGVAAPQHAPMQRHCTGWFPSEGPGASDKGSTCNMVGPKAIDAIVPSACRAAMCPAIIA